jgi:hypothetical protein
MANEKKPNENAGKKKYKYQIETTKPLIEGKTYQMTFIDKRTVKQEGEA